MEEKEILGSYSASIDDQAESAALVFERRLPVRELISHRFPLEQISEALELAAATQKDKAGSFTLSFCSGLDTCPT